MAKRRQIWLTCTVVLEEDGQSFTEVRKICYGPPRRNLTLHAMFRSLLACLDRQFQPCATAEGRE